MTYTTHFENSPDVGVFAIMTNNYCISAPSPAAHYFSLLESTLAPHGVAAFRSTIANSKLLGRLCAGNSKGLLLPSGVTDSEFLNIRNALPDDVVVQKLDERLSALGNIIACNDNFCLIHPDAERETEEVVADALGVEVVRHAVGGVGLVGSLMKVTNKGCLVGSNVSREEQEELASLLGVPVCSGTVNKGGQLVSGGILVNDFVGFVGRDCSNTEIGVVQAIFGLQMNQNAVDDMRKAFQDGFL
ncbi:Eukaryotic translation initiation factor 6 [Spironucleus salmonicida]|uniref:Eukaryotic translation initiation factor 6 n=1 Tax=Spironucleus salmonicida TaxID=348837 RepID=V6LX08_9EUKA|nr:Eukaryotic translation initiation factor 6 [Spironucleus salmonicida]|eukprot:EST48241.1 Eukaryotic translation initiation factor 6 [Spironucleus salmonicida]